MRSPWAHTAPRTPTMSGLMRESSSRSSMRRCPDRAVLIPCRLPSNTIARSSGSATKSNRLRPVLGQGVDEPAVALAVLGELRHVVRVEAVVQGVVGEQRADELGVEARERLAGGEQRLDRRVVLGVHEAHLDRGGLQHAGGVDRHGHGVRPGWAPRPASRSRGSPSARRRAPASPRAGGPSRPAPLAGSSRLRCPLRP